MPLTFSYKPLPKYVKLGESLIDGHGIIAVEFIPKATLVGVSHFIPDAETAHKFPQGIIRLPLGGFLNHSQNPNCMLNTEGKCWYLWTVEDIPTGDELCIDYELYACGAKENDE